MRSWCHLIGSDSSILIDEKLHYQESFIAHTIGGLDRVADSFIFDFLRDHIRRNSRSNQYSIILEILRYCSDDNLPVLISEQYDGHLICEVYFFLEDAWLSVEFANILIRRSLWFFSEDSLHFIISCNLHLSFSIISQSSDLHESRKKFLYLTSLTFSIIGLKLEEIRTRNTIFPEMLFFLEFIATDSECF